MNEKDKSNKCPKCTGEDIEYDCGFWKCNYCGYIWDDASENDYLDEILHFLDEEDDDEIRDFVIDQAIEEHNKEKIKKFKKGKKE